MSGERLADWAIGFAERGLVPDEVIRWSIRLLCTERLRRETRRQGRRRDTTRAFVESLRQESIAPAPQKANDQHYEVPTRFFQLMLGPRLKYSGCYWRDDTTTLAEAEQASLALTAEHAELGDGASVLELGCGWGSLSLWMAERYPHSRILAVSNSAHQRSYILDKARRRGLNNLEVETADMNTFHVPRRFDRVVSIEMFEHMRNYERLLDRVRQWLTPDGSLFVHLFCHRRLAYRFEEDGATNWMARHFFSGGLMPSADLLPSVPSPFALAERWTWDGRHYERTANAWLANLDAHREEALRVLGYVYGADQAGRWLGRWRIFLMACAELFGYGGGSEWGVAHYRFTPLTERSERVAV